MKPCEQFAGSRKLGKWKLATSSTSLTAGAVRGACRRGRGRLNEEDSDRDDDAGLRG